MHLALQVTAAKTSEFISSQHETPEAPIWSVKPTMQNRYVITSICSVSAATLPTTHAMPNTALCFGTVSGIPHTFRVRHSKCSAASSTQLPWKSDSTKIANTGIIVIHITSYRSERESQLTSRQGRRELSGGNSEHPGSISARCITLL